MRILIFCLLSFSVFGETWSDKNIRGRTAPATPFKAVQLFPDLKFNGVMALFPCPKNEKKLIIGELAGKIWLLGEDGKRHLVWKYDGGKMKGSFWDSGITLYSIAFDPEYPKKPYIYVVYNETKPKVSRIIRLNVSGKDDLTADPKSELTVFNWETRGHCGCELRFGPKDGYLYFATGDGGDPGDQRNIGQTVDNVLGSVIRIDVRNSTKEEPHKIPKDNPFVGMEGVRPEIWSYGLRNPFRMCFDPLSGKLLIADNGDQSWEYAFLTHKGANHGWSVFEGSHPFKTNLKIGGPTKEITHPVIERSHVDTRSIIGGFVYQQTKFPELKNHYLFGDYVTGLIWSAPWDGKKAGEHQKLTVLDDRVTCISYDYQGNIIMGSRPGKIWRLEKNEVKTDLQDYPKKLSGIGLFTSVKDHETVKGVLPYKINAPAWRDGAEVEKFTAIPDKEQLFLRWDAKWEIPDGGVIFQTLSLPVKTASGIVKKRIETQMIHREGMLYNFRTFKWNDEQTDADLVSSGGEYKKIDLGDGKKIDWQFQAINQCLTCHSSMSPSFTLGFDTSQLKMDEQIGKWWKKGLVKGNQKWLEKMAEKVNPHDETKDLESRVRSYLHVNCAHCHQQGGVGGRATFRLNNNLSLTDTKLIGEKPIVPLFSGPDGLLISPGNPLKSELYRRISIRGGGQMPLFGSSVEDTKGSELVRTWIEKLESK